MKSELSHSKITVLYPRDITPYIFLNNSSYTLTHGNRINSTCRRHSLPPEQKHYSTSIHFLAHQKKSISRGIFAIFRQLVSIKKLYTTDFQWTSGRSHNRVLACFTHSRKFVVFHFSFTFPDKYSYYKKRFVINGYHSIDQFNVPG